MTPSPNKKITKIEGGITNIVMAVAFAALSFVVAGLVLSYGALVNTNVATQFATNSTAYTISNNVTSGLNTFGSNMPTIAQVVVAVLVISLLFLGFGSIIGRAGGSGGV